MPRPLKFPVRKVVHFTDEDGALLDKTAKSLKLQPAALGRMIITIGLKSKEVMDKLTNERGE